MVNRTHMHAMTQCPILHSLGVETNVVLGERQSTLACGGYRGGKIGMLSKSLERSRVGAIFVEEFGER